jgi:hypothetical protein
MKYYAIYNTITKELFKGQVKCLNAEVENIEITKEVYDELEKYMYLDGSIVINPNYEAEQALKEKERIAKLSLTKREVFLGLYQAKGVTPEMIKAQITDPQALIEFEYANDYYRGNPLIDIVGATLGITPEQLDKFFETNDYTVLMPPVEEVENEDTENTTL